MDWSTIRSKCATLVTEETPGAGPRRKFCNRGQRHCKTPLLQNVVRRGGPGTAWAAFRSARRWATSRRPGRCPNNIPQISHVFRESRSGCIAAPPKGNSWVRPGLESRQFIRRVLGAPAMEVRVGAALPCLNCRGQASFSFRQAGQYQGTGVITGLGLRLRHLAQRKRLPFTAVFGRVFLPLLKMFAIGTSSRILSDCMPLAARQRLRALSFLRARSVK